MGLYSSFKTNADLEKTGISLDLGYVRIKLARAGGSNQRYNAAMEKVSKQHQRAIQNGLMENSRAMEILREVYAECVVLDWETNVAEAGDEPEFKRGIESPDGGELLPFNKENVIATLKALPDLFVELQTTATNIQFFRQSLIDDAVKN